MTKDTTDTLELGQSSQHTRPGPTKHQKASTEEELDIGQSIRSSFLWSFYKISLCKYFWLFLGSKENNKLE